MDGVFMVLVSVIIAVLLVVTFTAIYHSVGGMITTSLTTLLRVTTMMAVIHASGNTYYVEVVWVGPVIQPRYFVLANGQVITPPTPYQCGVGYTPAQYRYCLYELVVPAQPISFLMGG